MDWKQISLHHNLYMYLSLFVDELKTHNRGDVCGLETNFIASQLVHVP